MLGKRGFGGFFSVFITGVMLVLLVTTQGFTAKVNLRFAYPVELAGPKAKLINDLCAEFTSQNPEIKITPIYGGSYWETMDKVKVMVLADNSPDVAVLAKVNLPALRDIDAIIPLDAYVQQKGGQDYICQFFGGFLANSWLDGKLWSIPYQMSAPLLYYNKDLFREVGLDADRPPDTWSELTEYAKKLALRDDSGNVVRYGLEMEISDHWFIGATVLQNGGKLENEPGNEVYFDDESTIETLQWWVDLANKWKVMPQFMSASMSITDFAKGTTAMVAHSTGNLTFVRKNAPFDYGVAFLPKGKRRAVYSGGGTLFIFKDIPKEHQDAAWEFVDWMTAPDITARWSRDTGYLAVKRPAWDLTVMRQFVKENPEALVAIDELKYADREFMPHSFPEVAHLLVTAWQDALSGTVSPREALEKAQIEAMKVLEPFRS